jgi:hypothetical protein
VSDLDHLGLFTRSTADLALVYDALQGPDPSDPFSRRSESFEGKSARGFPALAETFGDDVAKCVAKWLDYKGGDTSRKAPDSEPFYNDRAEHEAPDFNGPKPIPGLPPVAAFEIDFLPGAIGPWVLDIADRMQCPLDFVGIPAMAALGAMLGPKSAYFQSKKAIGLLFLIFGGWS